MSYELADALCELARLQKKCVEAAAENERLQSYIRVLIDKDKTAAEIERLRAQNIEAAEFLEQFADRLKWFMEYVNYKHDDEFGNASADCRARAENLRK